jgi:tetratricopeptide (TPR) repeat protein
MDTKATLLDLLERAYKEEQAFVARLSDEERSAVGAVEQWSAKDVLAHVVIWKERRAQLLTPAARSEPPATFGDIDQVNAEIFEAHRHDSWAEILEHSEQAHRSLVERTQALEDDELAATDAFPWQTGRPLWRRIVGNGYIHPIAHFAEYYLGCGKVSYATEIQEEAARLLAQLDKGPVWQGVVHYNLACHYSLSGEKAKAIHELRETLRLNPELTEWSKEDSDLASIREEPDYQALYVE